MTAVLVVFLALKVCDGAGDCDERRVPEVFASVGDCSEAADDIITDFEALHPLVHVVDAKCVKQTVAGPR